MSARIAFLGVGQMGGAMAERLVGAGYELIVYDPSEAAVNALVARGAVAAASVRECIADCRVAFACLPSPAVSRQVALGVDGVGGHGSLEVYVETSTIGAAAVQDISEGLSSHGIRVLDAPVSGGPRGTRAGSLTTMVAGPRAAFDRVKPVLDALCGKVFYVSETPGHGQIVKLANNMISAACMSAASEAAVMAVKAGVDARTLIEIVNASTGRNGATMDKFPQAILPRTFDYGGKLSTMYKDVSLCFEEARRLEVPMWIGNSIVQLWFHAMCEGRGDDDYTTIIKVVEEWAGGVVVGDAETTGPNE
jgi:3-hydroxyisobutyrate dehydrogenase-like beta-hydroxyacid dehydrogenase